MRAILEYAFARVRARPGRALLGAGGVAAASTMLGAAITVALSLGGGFERAASRANLADVVARFDSAPAAVVRSRAAALPNVRALAVRYVAEDAELQVPGHHRYDAVLEGVNPGARGYAVVAGRDLRRPREALVERGVSRSWGIHPGASIIVGGSSVRVVGVAVEPDNVAFPLVGTPRVYVAYDVARSIGGAGRGSANKLLLWTRDPARLDVTLAQARAASFGLRSLELLTRTGIRLEIGRAAGLIISLLVAFSLIALAASAAILSASAASEVQRRLSSIGVLRALGASPRTLVAGPAAEAAVVALPAAALGLTIGWLAVRAPTEDLLASLNELAPGASLLLALVATLAAVVATVAVAAAIPAARAVRRTPVEALRGADAIAAPRRLPLPAGAGGLGLRLLAARPFRAATAVAVLAISAAFALLMLSIATLLGHLQSDPHALGREYQLSVQAEPDKLPAIRRLPGVVDAGVRYETWASDSFDLGETFKVVAFDRGHVGFEAPPLDQGRRVERSDEANVGVGLAQALQLHLGGTLPVQLDNGHEARFRVVGIVRALTQTGRVAYVTPRRLLDAEPWLQPTLAIKTEPGAVVDVQQELASRGLGWSSSSGVSGEGVQGWAARNSGFVGVLVSLLRLIAVIDILVCVYALAQVLALAAAERRQALAVIRALGAGRKQVRRVFTTAALGIALMAAPIAILLEREVAGPLVARLAAPYATISLAAGPGPLIAVLVALALAAMAAGAIVARRAAATPVTEALVEL